MQSFSEHNRDFKACCLQFKQSVSCFVKQFYFLVLTATSISVVFALCGSCLWDIATELNSDGGEKCVIQRACHTSQPSVTHMKIPTDFHSCVHIYTYALHITWTRLVFKMQWWLWSDQQRSDGKLRWACVYSGVILMKLRIECSVDLPLWLLSVAFVKILNNPTTGKTTFLSLSDDEQSCWVTALSACVVLMLSSFNLPCRRPCCAAVRCAAPLTRERPEVRICCCCEFSSNVNGWHRLHTIYCIIYT